MKSELFGGLVAMSFVLVACGGSPKPQTGADVSGNTSAPVAQAVTSAAKPSAFTVQINSAPLFESQQGWSAGYTKAVGHGPGVVVGPGVNNPNVFAQQFSAHPGEQFKVVARASSVNKPKAMGRIQINWVAAKGEFISVSSKAFEVTPEEKMFDLEVTAPAGAANGTLYVVGDGEDSVVRYTEMRLLGSEARGNAN